MPSCEGAVQVSNPRPVKSPGTFTAAAVRAEGSERGAEATAAPVSRALPSTRRIDSDESPQLAVTRRPAAGI
ncbi:hypothetical protein JOF53_003221 [Crossiella equi]|uniref:Uncharacterized protein n=1 Tax=Crossiella equi TaxID=130796 RepID=A0ABS5ACN8_9PSEU|nr:hypothetical protein [Crossiella equi]MBP2474349.1 hypothetical protein [Crossiella equi]